MKIPNPRPPTSDPWPPTADPRPAATIPSPPAFHLSPSTPRASREDAFSLTEVVIALGIFAVSMIGILALFPVASATGRESSEETQAAILAQTIFSDLRVSSRARGRFGGWIVKGPDTFATNQWILDVQPNVTRTLYVAYDLRPRVNSSGPDGIGMIGQPISLKAINTNISSASAFAQPITAPGAIFAAQISILPVENRRGLAQVTVTVETPASVPQNNRRSYAFQSLLYAP